jgi:hypothetical protein
MVTHQNEETKEAQNINSELTKLKKRAENSIKKIEEIENSISQRMEDFRKLEPSFKRFENIQTELEAIQGTLNAYEEKKMELGIDDQSALVLSTGYKKLESSIPKYQKAIASFDEIEKEGKTFLTNLRNSEKEIFGLPEESIEGIVTKINKEKDQLTKKMNDHTDQYSKDLSSKLENFQTSFETFLPDAEKKFNALIAKVESLLPNALSAGLSSSFQDKVDKEEKEKKSAENTFFWVSICLSISALIPLAINVWLLYTKHITLLELPNYWFKIALAMIPVYLPLGFISWRESKRINLSKRLIEEYTYKAVISKTFEGLSKQVDSHQSSESHLREKLLNNLLEANSDNPSKLLMDYNKVDHPLSDIFESSLKLTERMEFLAKTPGFETVAKFISAKENKKRNVVEKKIETGLETAKEITETQEENDDDAKHHDI